MTTETTTPTLTNYHAPFAPEEGSKPLTTRDVLKATGLDWRVGLHDVIADVDGEQIVVPDRFAVVRDVDKYPFGIVGAQYTPYQNEELVDLIESIVDDGDAEIATAGSFREGRTVFVSIHLKDHDVTVDGDDRSVPYLVIGNAHDGTMSLKAATTFVRVVCQNTLRLALRSAVSSWSIRHTQSIEGRVQEARNSLSLAVKYAQTFGDEIDKLVEQTVTDKQFDSIIARAFPIKDKESNTSVGLAQAKRDAVRKLYTESETIGKFQGTAYGVLNAFNEYELWQRPIQSNSDRIERQAMAALNGNFRLTDTVHSMLVKN